MFHISMIRKKKSKHVENNSNWISPIAKFREEIEYKANISKSYGDIFTNVINNSLFNDTSLLKPLHFCERISYI